MTASRYDRDPERRSRALHDEALNALQFGNPLPTFRASITDDFIDPLTERRQYDSLLPFGAIDTVFWDYWDENYDHRFFDPFIQPAGPDAGRIGAVELLIPGLYAIRAQIDWEDFFTGDTYLGSNYDDGGTDHWYREQDVDVSPAFAINHFRHVWPSLSSSEGWVEIIVGHTHADPHYIPGGSSGAWAIPPHLSIIYLGGLGTEPNYYEDT